MIKNIEDLKRIQIVCKNQKDIEDCLNMLEELGFEVENNDNKYRVIYYSYYNSKFENGIRLECERNTYFFNKKFIKILQKFIKEKEQVISKSEIETKLKNIAERLNAGRKIDWKNGDQKKFSIYYDYDSEILDYDFRLMFKVQGTIYCLNENFLEVAKLEIGEENLIKYFEE